MVKESPRQQATVERVMHEFKHGELESAGRKVRNPRQAIAIGLSEAGVSRKQTRKKADGQTRDALLKQAAAKGVRGRSRMTKTQLQQALNGKT